MKEFNKEKELNKLRLKNNKSKYIKYGSIILSVLILVVGIIYFTFAKFESNKSYTLIEGRIGDYSSGDITLSYVVDGVSQSVPPQKGTGYKLKSINCTNAEGTWDKNGWGVYINNISGKAKCNLEFETVTEVNVTLYSAAVDEVYYYDNGEKVILGTTDSTGKLENAILKVDDITLYSSVAKNPDNLSEDYSKLISLDGDEENIYVMPDGALYWYGFLKYETIPNVQTTFNSNNIYQYGGSTYAWTYFNNIFNLSNYNSVIAIAKGTRNGQYWANYALFSSVENTYKSSIRIVPKGVEASDYTKITLDVQNYSQNAYVGLYSEGSSSSIRSTLYIQALWLE